MRRDLFTLHIEWKPCKMMQHHYGSLRVGGYAIRLPWIGTAGRGHNRQRFRKRLFTVCGRHAPRRSVDSTSYLGTCGTGQGVDGKHINSKHRKGCPSGRSGWTQATKRMLHGFHHHLHCNSPLGAAIMESQQKFNGDFQAVTHLGIITPH